MTYQEFKNNYSFDTGKGHINFYNKAKDELYNFFDIFYQNMPYISVEELLSSEQMKENIQTLLDNLKNRRFIFLQVLSFLAPIIAVILVFFFYFMKIETDITTDIFEAFRICF